MRLSTWALLIITLVSNALIWGFVNKPHSPLDAQYPIHSLSFNPYKRDQSPFDNRHLNEADIVSDLEAVKGKARLLRVYASNLGLEEIPEIAKSHGYEMHFMMSANLEKAMSDEEMDQEVERAVSVTGYHRNVERLIIGNETQLLEKVSREKLVGYLREARNRLRTPVSTAEPWDYWINHPELADEVDFIALHILPYWVEVPIEKAVDYTFEKYRAVKNTFPYKMVMIAETGWPSDGPQRGAAQASLQNQAAFVREFVARAEKENIKYNIIEAFDQPWKSMNEGRAGEHWGIMNADRVEKFPLKGPVLEDPNWKFWALSSAIIGFLSAGFFLFRRRGMTLKGQIFSVIIFQMATALVVELARTISDQYMSPGDIVFWTVMITMQSLLAIILLTDAAEIADVVGQRPLQRKFVPYKGDRASVPMVSLHLACCKEPPEMVIATINSLSKLDYPNFEVLVVDNNTPDPELWKPVEARCQELGSRFRFFSLGSYPGYKAGALNFALRETHPDAAIVGVVDADYVVESDWLSATVPYFQDQTVGVVQAPQEHRDYDGNVFKQMENDEYSGFFRIGMVQRNEHNAIIQHGTMTLIRRSSLQQLGGWAEWCICEDAELGLRIINEGLHAIYIDHAFGRGLVPDSYEAYSKQRFRWAYGAMRIMRHHWRKFAGLEGTLAPGQRYQFVKGWLPWIGDALHLLFSATAFVWSLVLLSDPLHTDFPNAIFIYPALALVVLRIGGTLWTYAARVRIGRTRTIMAMIAGGSLTHKIAKAVLQGLFTSSKPFIRTPKMAQNSPMLRSLMSVYEEIGMGLLLISCAVVTLISFGTVNDQAVLWAVALTIQTFPYWSAVTAAIVGGRAPRRLIVK